MCWRGGLSNTSPWIVLIPEQFQPITTALDGTFDTIMGMGFRMSSRACPLRSYLTVYIVRNTYTLVNFGDFVDGNPDNQSNPFMQLLSVTDPSQAHQDFVRARLNGTDTTGDSAHALLPASQGQHSPESLNEKAKNTFYRNWPYIGAAVGLVLVAILAVVVFKCCCRSRQGPVKGQFVAGPYRPLHEPAPGPAMYLHTMPPQGAYSDPYYRG